MTQCLCMKPTVLINISALRHPKCRMMPICYLPIGVQLNSGLLNSNLANDQREIWTLNMRTQSGVSVYWATSSTSASWPKFKSNYWFLRKRKMWESRRRLKKSRALKTSGCIRDYAMWIKRFFPTLSWKPFSLFSELRKNWIQRQQRWKQ